MPEALPIACSLSVFARFTVTDRSRRSAPVIDAPD
jgi:hypothetical protein